MQFARHYFARNSHERLAIKSRHTFCARFSLGPDSFTFVYGFQSGYLERLKEQLNEVKTVRVPVALSRLISMPFLPFFFSTVPPELRPEIRLVLFQRCVTGLSPGPARIHTSHSAANSYRRHGYVSEIF